MHIQFLTVNVVFYSALADAALAALLAGLAQQAENALSKILAVLPLDARAAAESLALFAPLRGLDPGASEAVNELIREACRGGTAIVVGAAMLNALKVVGKDIARVKVVASGAGAAALAGLGRRPGGGGPRRSGRWRLCLRQRGSAPQGLDRALSAGYPPGRQCRMARFHR